jgi:hypothetical protein
VPSWHRLEDAAQADVTMPLKYTKHEPISLRKHPDFSEVWLHDRIADDPAILGLGDLDVIQREKVQFAGGRLDMLLADTENSIRAGTPTRKSSASRSILHAEARIPSRMK